MERPEWVFLSVRASRVKRLVPCWSATQKPELGSWLAINRDCTNNQILESASGNGCTIAAFLGQE
jgi:hypothetical protein